MPQLSDAGVTINVAPGWLRVRLAHGQFLMVANRSCHTRRLIVLRGWRPPEGWQGQPRWVDDSLLLLPGACLSLLPRLDVECWKTKDDWSYLFIPAPPVHSPAKLHVWIQPAAPGPHSRLSYWR